MWPNPKEIADMVTFTEEIINGKIRFFLQWQFFASQKVNSYCYKRVMISMLLYVLQSFMMS